MEIRLQMQQIKPKKTNIEKLADQNVLIASKGVTDAMASGDPDKMKVAVQAYKKKRLLQQALNETSLEIRG